MSGITIPEIRINYAWLLQMDVSRQLNKSNKWPLPTDEEAEEYTENYRNAWKPKEVAILTEMQKCLGLTFYKKVLDVNVAADIVPKSHPLIISFSSSPDQFVDTLMHELIHLLLTDNTTITLQGDMRNFKLATLWRRLFYDEPDFVTLIHIPVHAVMKKIILDALHEGFRVDRDKETIKKYGNESYLKSWDYVEKVGHEEIIAKKSKYLRAEKYPVGPDCCDANVKATILSSPGRPSSALP